MCTGIPIYANSVWPLTLLGAPFDPWSTSTHQTDRCIHLYLYKFMQYNLYYTNCVIQIVLYKSYHTNCVIQIVLYKLCYANCEVWIHTRVWKISHITGSTRHSPHISEWREFSFPSQNHSFFVLVSWEEFETRITPPCINRWWSRENNERQYPSFRESMPR